MNHDLKIERPYFQAIRDGRKTFEIRYNDRGFNAGDTVTLKEYDGFCFSGEQETRRIGYVTGFSQHPNWVVFSLLPLEVKP
ncbi:MAG: DUF3850 domain-containing protein [Acidobacteria bacterium]|nr:DUF3850 domain-containing protein [Acidobacteriota bacterium]